MSRYIPRRARINLDNRVVTPGFFKAMGVPLLAGRSFEWSDRRDTPHVVLVNDAFIRGSSIRRGMPWDTRITMDVGSD